MKTFYFVPFSRKTEPNLRCLALRLIYPWVALIDALVPIFTLTLIRTNLNMRCAMELLRGRVRDKSEVTNHLTGES